MGWSCTAAAMATLHEWERACLASSGIRNALDTPTGRLCWELGHNQHSDGICGEVWRWADGSTVGSFFIGPDGRPVDFPPVLLPIVAAAAASRRRFDFPYVLRAGQPSDKVGGVES